MTPAATRSNSSRAFQSALAHQRVSSCCAFFCGLRRILLNSAEGLHFHDQPLTLPQDAFDALALNWFPDFVTNCLWGR